MILASWHNGVDAARPNSKHLGCCSAHVVRALLGHDQKVVVGVSLGDDCLGDLKQRDVALGLDLELAAVHVPCDLLRLEVKHKPPLLPRLDRELFQKAFAGEAAQRHVGRNGLVAHHHRHVLDEIDRLLLARSILRARALSTHCLDCGGELLSARLALLVLGLELLLHVCHLAVMLFLLKALALLISSSHFSKVLCIALHLQLELRELLSLLTELLVKLVRQSHCLVKVGLQLLDLLLLLSHDGGHLRRLLLKFLLQTCRGTLRLLVQLFQLLSLSLKAALEAANSALIVDAGRLKLHLLFTESRRDTRQSTIALVTHLIKVLVGLRKTLVGAKDLSTRLL
eukprot:m.166240 g.166240  ORF g.166240 m.166240 type:complete len:341 (+) comp10335_c1_seq23:226-1248(+)